MKPVSNSNLTLSRTTAVIIRSNHPVFEPRIMKTVRILQEKRISVIVIGWDRNTASKVSPMNITDGAFHLFRVKTPIGTPLISVFLPLWWYYVFVTALPKSGTVLHACDFDTLIPSLLVKIFTRRKLVYDMYDFYSDRLPEKSWIRRALGFLEKFLARFADVVILADDQRREQVKGLKAQRIATIYNSPPSISSLNKPTKFFDNQFTLFYCGTLDLRRGIVSACKAVEELSGVRLILAGYTGPHYKDLLSFIKECNNTTFIGPLEYDEVLEFTQRSDALFALYDPAVPNYRFASPNKLFEAMMCGKPIIVSSNTLMANRVIRHGCGIVVRYGDIESLRKVIQHLKDDPTFARQLGENGRKAYHEFYDWSIMKRRLMRIYNQILM